MRIFSVFHKISVFLLCKVHQFHQPMVFFSKGKDLNITYQPLGGFGQKNRCPSFFAVCWCGNPVSSFPPTATLWKKGRKRGHWTNLERFRSGEAHLSVRVLFFYFISIWTIGFLVFLFFGFVDLSGKSKMQFIFFWRKGGGGLGIPVPN